MRWPLRLVMVVSHHICRAEMDLMLKNQLIHYCVKGTVNIAFFFIEIFIERIKAEYANVFFIFDALVFDARIAIE